jgi:hypothetical protein
MKSKDYIRGFRHGVAWAIAMAKCEIASLEISLENIRTESKEAIKSLKQGR